MYEETEELKESNDWELGQKKREERQKAEEMRMADEARAAQNAMEDAEKKKVEKEKRAAQAGRDRDPESLEKEWREGMSKEEERAWKEKMRNTGSNSGMGSAARRLRAALASQPFSGESAKAPERQLGE